MIIRPIVAASVLSLVCSISSLAQTVNTKAGLWIVANKSVVNGKQLPGILDIKGINESEKQRIRNALKSMGMPTDWNPSFYCQKSDTIDINDILRKVQAECPNPIIKVNGSKVTYSGQCHTEQGNANISGNITMISNTQTKGEMDASIAVQGQQITMHQQDLSKWIGSNCNVPPAGIDPMWIQSAMVQ